LKLQTSRRRIALLSGGGRRLRASDAARVQAVGMLLDRGWGKAPQPQAGADGDGDIRITIRQIVEGKE